MVERRWKKWVYFYIPLSLIVLGALFPFYWMLITAVRPDVELYRSWRAANNTPLWTLAPTLAHVQDLLARTTFPRWLWNTFFIAVASTGISLFCGLLAGYSLARLRFPMAGTLGTGDLRDLSGPPTVLFIPLANIIRSFRLGDTPWALILTYPTFLIPFCTWLLMGYFKTIPRELEECARIDGRPASAPWRGSSSRSPCRASSPRGSLPSRSPGTNSSMLSSSCRRRTRRRCPSGRLRADSRRCLLLGTADGGGTAGIGPGGARLFVLRRVLRGGADRLGQGVADVPEDRLPVILASYGSLVRQTPGRRTC